MFEYKPTPEQRRNLIADSFEELDKERKADQVMAFLDLLMNAGKALDRFTEEELDAMTDEEIEKLCEEDEE
jgi:N-acyl-D-aspartate/D-glutamate deacylase